MVIKRTIENIIAEADALSNQGLKSKKIAEIVNIPVDVLSRLRRINKVAKGMHEYSINANLVTLAKELIEKFDRGELTPHQMIYQFDYVLRRTGLNHDRLRSKLAVSYREPNTVAPIKISSAQLLEQYNRSITTLEGSSYALSKLPDEFEFTEDLTPEQLSETIDRLAKVRRVIEIKVNELRRAHAKATNS